LKLAPSLEAVGLTKKFGQFTALSQLNLKLQGAKCIGFLGPNGAGKTTTMKIFTGLISASDGVAKVNGVDVRLDKKAALSSCSAKSGASPRKRGTSGSTRPSPR